MGFEPVRIAESIRLGETLELDLRAYELRRSGRVVKLERIPMELLLLLVEHRGELVTREQILERIWGKDVFLDCDSSINAAVRKIRQALKDDPDHPRYIQTITGKGYRFIAAVVEHGAPSQPDDIPKQTTAPDGWLGKKISHYRVLQLLGGGGMGVVYKAEDLKLGRSVAMKFLPSELASDSLAFERLQREARAASCLDHPNICSIYELDEHEGQPFIVMQLLEGETLRDWIEHASGKSSGERLGNILDFAIQICRGLEAAHAKGIIHRDIKPANVFITARGEAKILDFGVAKFVTGSGVADLSVETSDAGKTADKEKPDTADPQLTRTGLSLGTPSYLSPEQVRREELDGRTDLFSFGLVLHEMATGRRTFLGNTAAAIRDAVLTQPAKPIRELNPELPSALQKIIDKALEKDRGRRYPSAGELRIDLERLNKASQPNLFWGRKKWRLSAAVALLGLTVSLGLMWKVSRLPVAQKLVTPKKPRRSVAVLGFRNLSGKPDQDWISTALGEMLSTELASGSQLRVIPGENVAHMRLDLALPLTDSYSRDTLLKIRRNVGTDAVLVGSYLDLGQGSDENLRVDLRLQDANAGETIAAISETGSETQIPEMVSKAGADLREKLGIASNATDNLPQLRASLPSNPEAARFYSEGLAKLRVFDVSAARDLLEKAVAGDPNHALSHSALAEALSGLGYDTKAQAEAKRAFELSQNLPREDQLVIEGRYRQLTHDLPAAIEAYRTLWKFFPDDLEYGLRLAESQIKGGSPKDALVTTTLLRKLPAPESQDARIDITEAHSEETLSHFVRTQELSRDAVTKAERQDSRLLMARALQQEGFATDHLGDRQTAIVQFRKAHDLWADAGDGRGSASALHAIAIVQYNVGDFEGARNSFEQALQTLRQIGAMWDIASCSHNLGVLLKDEGKLPEARQAFEEALHIQRALNDERGVASDLDDIGNVMLAEGDLAAAVQIKQQALQSFRQLGNKLGEAITLNNLGEVHIAQGELARAKDTLDQSLALKREIGYKDGIGYTLLNLSEAMRRQDRLADARATTEQALNLRKELGNEVQLADAQVQLAEIDLQEQNAKEAESLSRGAEAIYAKHKIADKESISESALSEALLAEGKKSEARAAADRAIALSQQGGDLRAHFDAALSDAEVKAASGANVEAAKTLESLHLETGSRGYVGYELEADLRLGEVEVNSGKLATGRARLTQVQRDATARGFAFIAREAATAKNNAQTRSGVNKT